MFGMKRRRRTLRTLRKIEEGRASAMASMEAALTIGLQFSFAPVEHPAGWVACRMWVKDGHPVAARGRTPAEAFSRAFEAMGAPTERCEGCSEPATTYDAESVPLCRACMDALIAEGPPKVDDA